MGSHEMPDFGKSGFVEKTEDEIKITPEEMGKAVDDYQEKKVKAEAEAEKIEPIKEQIRQKLKKEGEELDEGILQEVVANFVSEKEQKLQEKRKEWDNYENSFYERLSGDGKYENLTEFQRVEETIKGINMIDKTIKSQFQECIPETQLLKSKIDICKAVLTTLYKNEIELLIIGVEYHEEDLKYISHSFKRERMFLDDREEKKKIKEMADILDAKISNKDYDEEKYAEIIDKWKEEKISELNKKRKEIEDKIKNAEKRIAEIEKEESEK